MDLLFVCLHQKENEWLLVASSRFESSEIKYLMRLRFQEGSLRHLFTYFARVTKRVAALLPGTQFLVINTVKEIDMMLLYDLMVWLGQNREMGHPGA